MQIKVIDADKLEIRHAYWGYSVSHITTYEVLAVIQVHKKRQYLVEDDMRLNWWDADLFSVVDGRIPEQWIRVKYKYFHSLQNKKYNFRIPLNLYCGPRCFLEYKDFLFDTFENPRIAYAFYKSHSTGDGSTC